MSTLQGLQPIWLLLCSSSRWKMPPVPAPGWTTAGGIRQPSGKSWAPSPWLGICGAPCEVPEHTRVCRAVTFSHHPGSSSHDTAPAPSVCPDLSPTPLSEPRAPSPTPRREAACTALSIWLPFIPEYLLPGPAPFSQSPSHSLYFDPREAHPAELGALTVEGCAPTAEAG